MGSRFDTTWNRLRKSESAERDLRLRCEQFGWNFSDYLERRAELHQKTRAKLPSWAIGHLSGRDKEWLDGLYCHQRPAVKWVLYVTAEGEFLDRYDSLPELIKEQMRIGAIRGAYYWIATRTMF